jgi:hypothetical protein
MQFVTSMERRKQYGSHTRADNSLTPGLSKPIPQSTIISLSTNINHLTSRSDYVPHSGHYMYRTVVTICTTSLTFNNSTFCPHSVFVFCVDLRTNSDYFPIQN